MNETHDTIDGLLAEFRGYSHGMPPSYHVTMSWADFRKMLDRFDAAYKREKAAIEADALSAGGLVEAMRQKKATAEKSSAVGDAAKLREAVKLCMDEMCNRCRDLASARGNPLPCLQGCEPIRKAKAALSAPPRNCDIYLTEEAVDAATVTVRDCEACSRIDMEAPCVFCMVRWLLAPATEKEGGAK